MSTSLKITKSSSGSGLFGIVKGHKDSMSEKDHEESQSFDEERKDVEIFSLGSVPPESGDILDWVKQSQDEPMPLAYTLGSIAMLFVPEKFPWVKNIDRIQRNVFTALQDYDDMVEASFAPSSLRTSD